MSIYSKDDWLSTKRVIIPLFSFAISATVFVESRISRPIATLGLVGTWIGDGVGIPDVADNFCNFALVKVLKR
uniref:Na_Ca_ex domain-containing protein n=2 Tax=Loa loa TaxID=7209 RepID=A0A1I7VIY9_LOALO